MKNKMMQSISGTMLVCVLFFSGCEKDKKDSVPELPPLSTFSMNFDAFSVGKSTGTYNNVLTAAFVTGYWNTVLTAYLIVPVASYKEAFNHQAKRVDNNTWEWAYDVTVNDTIYSASLSAKLNGDLVSYEMRISQEGGFQDFLWYTGTCNIQRTEGQWSIRDNPESNTEWVGIVWNHDYTHKTFDVKYTNTYPAGEYTDSYIQYGIRTDSAYDAFYEIFSSAQDKTYTIDFNTATHEGRINYDSLWHCWDNQYSDTVCAE